MSQLNDILKENKYDEIIKEINDLNKAIHKIDQSFPDIDKIDISTYRDLLQKISNDIVLYENDITNLSQQLPIELANRESESSKLQNKLQQLNSIKSEFNHITTKSILDSYKAKASEYKNIFDQMGLMDIKLITRDEYNAAMESLNKLKNMANALINNYSIDDIDADINNRQSIQSIIQNIPILESSLKFKEKEYNETLNKITLYNTKREIASELVNRPAKCKIDNCIYIAAALKADREYPEKDLIELQNTLKTIETDMGLLNNDLDKARTAMLIRRDVSIIETELSSGWKFINKLPIRRDFVETFMSRVVSLDTFTDIDDLYKFVDCGNMIQDYQLLLDNISIYEAEYKLYESKAAIIDTIQSDIDDLRSRLQTIDTFIERINNSIKENQNLLDDIHKSKEDTEHIISIYDNQYIPNKSRLNELNNIKTNLDISVISLSEMDNNLAQLNTNLGSINQDIKNLTTQRESLSHSLMMLNEYKTELNQYQKEYTLVDKIRYYSSPSTGVQNIFLSIFMSKILQTANELLSLLFGGKFMFGNFVINESEFRITAMSESGIMHSDISEMSSAEKSMLSLVISFALLHASSTRYNILTLDEIDGALDSDNRMAFVNLIDRMMNILSIEQVFIISHNPEIDMSACDVINLRQQQIIGSHVIWHV